MVLGAMLGWLAVAAVGAQAAPPAMEAAAVLRPPPATAWRLVREGEACTLRRMYGTADAPVTVIVRQSPVGVFASLFVGRKGDGRRVVSRGTIEVAGEADAVTVARYPLPTRGREGLAIATRRLSAAAVARDPVVKVTAAGMPALTLELAALDQSWGALDACNAALLTSWKLTAAKTAAVPARLTGNWAQLEDSYDYWLIQAVGGVTVAVFEIGTDGRAHNCRIGITSGSAMLDGKVCRSILDHGRADPARNADGEPVAILSSYSLHWTIDRAGPPGLGGG